jgi:hypothetical protein
MLQVWQWPEGHNTMKRMVLSTHGRVDTLVELIVVFQLFAATPLSMVFLIRKIPFEAGVS